ncbi:MAG: hypothetical protein GY720_16855 [bacterium]|nr:hypothetical protein [bacterium]
MVDLPPQIDASAGDKAEAEAVAARIDGPGSVAAALAADIADGIGDRDLVLTATGAVGRLAAQYWEASLGSAGVGIHNLHDSPTAGAAWVHLHGEGAANLVVGDLSDGDLVGEVIGQGTSAAARYSSLTIVADALAAAMRPSP